MTSNKTYLITGANRGIGKGLTTSLLQRPSTTVIAAVRDIEKSTAGLTALPTGAGSKLIVVNIDSQSESDAVKVISELQEKHGITSLDVVIANAGISYSNSPVMKNSPEVFRDHINTNTIGPILLFQATAPLLKVSKNAPVFLAISTIIGSIGGQDLLAALPPQMSPYGASKTALNWVVKRIHIEEPWLTAYVTHPGLVLTDMTSALTAGQDIDLQDLGAITVDVSVTGILKTLDSASRDISGTFQNYDGSVLPW